MINSKDEVLKAIEDGVYMGVYKLSEELLKDTDIQYALIQTDSFNLRRIHKITKEVPPLQFIEVAANDLMDKMLTKDMSFTNFQLFAIELKELNRLAVSAYGKELDLSAIYNSKDKSIREFYKLDPEVDLSNRIEYENMMSKDFTKIFDQMTSKQLEYFRNMYQKKCNEIGDKDLQKYTKDDIRAVAMFEKLINYEPSKRFIIGQSKKSITKKINDKIANDTPGRKK